VINKGEKEMDLKNKEKKEMKEFKSAEIATNWWADKILDGSSKDAGFNDEQFMESLMFLLSSIESANKLTFEQIEIFKTELKNSINHELNNWDSVHLKVDYNPEGLLKEAATKAKINCGVGSSFPFKTFMIVTKDNVKVSCGYAKAFETLYDESQLNLKEEESLSK